MSDLYIMDACALIAMLTREAGAEAVRAVVHRAYNSEAHVSMHKLNLLEVYYGDCRVHGKMAADNMLNHVKKLPITIISEISDEVFNEAGRLKATYKISLADSIAL
ncbi:MAG: PIN domain-containing protein, partial [Synergistaceae bacterium]|nr:PIN domain-containing protein [Synergistaceae bacterium]